MYNSSTPLEEFTVSPIPHGPVERRPHLSLRNLIIERAVDGPETHTLLHQDKPRNQWDNMCQPITRCRIKSS